MVTPAGMPTQTAMGLLKSAIFDHRLTIYQKQCKIGT